MLYKKQFLTVLTIFILSIATIAQNNEVESLHNVDFNRLQSINLSQLELQAHLWFLKPDYEKAAKYYLEIINHNIDDSDALYKLACCYAMLNKPDYAGNFLVLAINAGYNDFDQIKQEKSFELIKSDKQFEIVMNDVLNYGKIFGETFYVDANVLVKSRIIFPKDFNINNSYNLLIGLHGYGSTAEKFTSIASYLESNNYIVVIPEAPYLKNEQGYRKFQYSWDFGVREKELWKISDPSVMDYIIRVVDYCGKQYKIEKRYLLGFSQGAAYAYAVGIKNPDKIDAVIACGGRIPDVEKYPWFISKEDLIKGNKLKVCIMHGKQDNAISYKKSIQAKKTLSKLNYNVNLVLFEGGHAINKNALNESLKWIEKDLK